MIKTAEGIAKHIIYQDKYICKLIVQVGQMDYNCINYPFMTGVVTEGDHLLLNTTAIELQLGTGGFHFVIANLSRPAINTLGSGHIMKMKYTPMQMNFMTAETQESVYHHIFNEFESLKEMPVIVGSLHSMLAPCAVYLKSCMKDIKICYIMTEGGALPLQISDIVRNLKESGYIDATVTYGNAFGGDYECVNIYTALITAKEIAKADVAIVCMGPGIVGTDTRLGFSGVEQGIIGDAVNKLGGYSILTPRISFSESRVRHYGISHHSITVLKQLSCTKVNVPIPAYKNIDHLNYIKNQIDENGLGSLHNIYYVDISGIDEILTQNSVYMHKMGKDLMADKEYFIGCAVSAKLCVERMS